ncbi:MAG: hypothetical protein GTO63_15630 [Anaerolineae bacterium]|nr:hypothetical protein [Anaerolineae bacterium]NIN96260.1 hypothetical protein [Anaerolineae bacterium]NIQ79280.1 hypothetical protein [Anaerolineae bacterium]
MAKSRRVMGDVPRLTRRPWESAARGLEEFLKKLAKAWQDGIPPGGSTSTPTTIEAGDTGTSGAILDGWAPITHEHPVVTGAPSPLANTDTEGTSTAIPRLDHQHKRDVRVKEDGADVSTRNALDFRNADMEWTITDDPGNDEVDIIGKLSATSRTFVAGGTRVSATGASDAVVWEAPYDATVIAVRGLRVNGGTGATVNARRNFTSEHLASDLSLPTTGTVYDGGTPQNTAYVAGDILEARIKSVSGGSCDITVLIRLRRD